MFCVVLVVSNIAATKGTEFFSGDVSLGPVQIIPVFSDGGAVLFPLAYIIGDVISEVYGLKAARRAIFVGFGTAIMAFVTFLIVIQLPSASFYENQEAFESVVWSGVQIVAASLIAYVVGQFLNSYVLVRMKARSAEPGLWRRLASSTGVGEAADTFIFCAIAASAIGISTGGDFVNYFVVGFLFKCAVETARHAADHAGDPRPQGPRRVLLGLSGLPRSRGTFVQSRQPRSCRGNFPPTGERLPDGPW